MTAMTNAYDVPLEYLSRWRAGHCDQFGAWTASGLVHRAKISHRHWWFRAKSLRRRMRENDLSGEPRVRELQRDHVARAWFWRREARARRAAAE